MLVLKNISKSYNGQKVLDNISFNFTKGQALGIAGESGAGKSTLARIILGLEKPSGGKVILKGRDLTEEVIENRQASYRNMQMIFQNSLESLDPTWTIGRAIVEALNRDRSLSKEQKKKLLYESLEDVGLKEDLVHKRPLELSGGELQRVSIARAIIARPDLIICDEPTSSLDFIVRKKILGLFKDLREKYKLSFIIISHDLSLLKELCDRVLIMKNGKIVDSLDLGRSSLKSQNPYTLKMLGSMATKDPCEKNIIGF